MKIIADHREKGSGIIDRLLREAANVVVQTLRYGDYRINNWITVERKTAEDFLISIIDGRLFRQASSLKKNCPNPIFLVEGNPYRTKLKMDKRSIQGALICLQTIWYIPVALSSSVTETVEILKLIGLQTDKHAEALLPRGGYRPRRLMTRKLYILQGLPSVGPVLAKRLLSHFGSVFNVMNAGAEELSVVRGIGQETAKRIRAVLDVTEQNLEDGLTMKNMAAEGRPNHPAAATISGDSEAAVLPNIDA